MQTCSEYATLHFLLCEPFMCNLFRSIIHVIANLLLKFAAFIIEIKSKLNLVHLKQLRQEITAFMESARKLIQQASSLTVKRIPSISDFCVKSLSFFGG